MIDNSWRFLRKIYYGVPALYLETLKATKWWFAAFAGCIVIPLILWAITAECLNTTSDPYRGHEILLLSLAKVTRHLDSQATLPGWAPLVERTLTTSERVTGMVIAWAATIGFICAASLFFLWLLSVARFMSERRKRPLL